MSKLSAMDVRKRISSWWSEANLMERSLAWWRAARLSRYFWWGIVGAAIVIFADQLSKYWVVNIIELPEQIRPCIKNPLHTCRQIAISPLFDLTYVENRGASFGFLSGMRVILSLISAGVAVGLIIWLGQLRRMVTAFGASFIIGGALGNLYDRIMYGYVVDFLDFSSVPFPNIARVADFPYIEIFIGGFIWVFNVADMAINVGVAFLILDAWQTREHPADKA